MILNAKTSVFLTLSGKQSRMQPIFDLSSIYTSQKLTFLSFFKTSRSKANATKWLTILVSLAAPAVSLADPVQLDFTTLPVNHRHDLNDQIYVTCIKDSLFDCVIDGNSVGAVPGWYPPQSGSRTPSGEFLYFYGFSMNIGFLQEHPTFFSFDIANTFLGSQCFYRSPSQVSATAVVTSGAGSIKIYPVTMDGQHFEFSHVNGLSTVIVEVGCLTPLGPDLYDSPIWLTNAVVDFGNPIDLSVSKPLVSQPLAAISQDDLLLHVKPGIPVTVDVPVKELGVSSTDSRTVLVTLQAGSQPIQSKSIAISNIRADGTTTIPFEVTFLPKEAGVQTLTVTVNPGNAVSESYTLNNTSSVQIYVEGQYKLISQISNRASVELKMVPGNQSVTAQYPLGSIFTIQLVKSGTNGQPDQPLKATYQLGAANISPAIAGDVDTLFPNLAALRFGDNIATDGPITFQSIHLGQVPLTITPSDTPEASISVDINIQSPQHLGDSDSEYDSLIIPIAHLRGIPPQFLKGQIAQEGSFDPMAYRYEPIGSTSDLRSFSDRKIPGIKITDHRASEPYIHYLFATDDGSFSQGDELTNSDNEPRTDYQIFTDPYWYLSTLVGPPSVRPLALADQYVSVRRIYSANDTYMNWSKHASSAIKNAISIDPNILNYTAQTAVAASYGLMQILYTTAIDTVKWDGRNSDHSKNPHYLFDTPENIADGGGTLNIGAEYFVAQFISVNDSNPSVNSLDDVKQVFIQGYNCYNNCDLLENEYGSNVIIRSENYLPVTQTPVFQ